MDIESIRDLFKMIDHNNSGNSITRDKLKELLHIMNMDTSNDNLDVLLQV